MTPRAAWRWCAMAGAVAFACSWAFGQIPGLVACGPTGGLGPIIAFEFVRSPADVAALFGTDPCRSVFAAAQGKGLLLDGFGFIPAYTAFLILAVLAATAGARWRWIVIAALAIAGLSDEIEGFILYAILRDFSGTSGLISVLWWAVHVKFALLAAGTAGVGALLMRRHRWLPRIAGIVIAISGLVALYGLAGSPGREMMQGFAAAWFTLLAAAFVASFWPSVFSPVRAFPPQAPVTPSA